MATSSRHPIPRFPQFVALFLLLGFSKTSCAGDPPLTLDYYKSSCPSVLEIVRKEMECAVLSNPRNGGCDGSVLLDDTITLQGEKKAPTNVHSLGGFRIIDRIKNMLESECPGVVSCADILTVAARDATLLITDEHRFSVYSRTELNRPGGGNNTVAPLDYVTPNLFDNSIYHLLLQGEGLLNSDQEIYSSILAVQTREIVRKYAVDPIAFFVQFSESMVRMGNITNPRASPMGK
ncbi:hypothetical protein NL676_032190 [Syzygium grande]|nr:hypothetical protein NL676_032190 [Syzygium grande]